MKRFLPFILGVLFLLPTVSWGQLLQWNTFGNAGTETTEPSVYNDPNISAVNLTQGTITAATNANRFGGSGWFNTGNTAAGNTLAEAIAGNDYIQFIVTPNSGYSFTPTSFYFSWQSSASGPKTVTLRSSADSYSTDLGSTTVTASIATYTITISGLTNLTSETTFRLYGYGSTATSGTGGFDVSSNLVNVQLNGTSASTSTPAILLSSPSQTSAGNINQGATNQILSHLQAAVTVANATLTGITFTSAGTYSAADINNFKVYYASTDDFGSASSLGTVSTSLDTGSHSLSSLSQSINSGTTGYFWITCDVNSAATALNTINVAVDPTLTFATGTPSGSISAGGTQTIQSVTPEISLSSPNPAVAVGNITHNTTNNVIYRFDAAVTTANATLSGLQITTTGTYVAADLTNLKAWYSSDNTFNSGSDVLLSTKSTDLSAGVQVFPSWTNQVITSGSTGYIFITTDVPCGATNGSTIAVNAVTTSDVSFLTGNKSGSTNAGGTQTLQYASASNVTSPTGSTGNAQVTLTWTNPTDCYSEIMIIAKASSSIVGTPSGDGSAYTANLAYSAGTEFGTGDGYVVYKGSTSSQTVTGLTNGTTYYFKYFTKNGTNWSSGTEVSATPAVPLAANDIMITHLSADYGGSSDEFVVLFNNTNSSIDLNGNELKYFSSTGSAGSTLYNFNAPTIIPSRKYILIAANATVTVGTVAVARDYSLTAGMAASGQLVLRQTSNTSNIIFAVAWGTITGYTASMTDAAAWPADGMISLSPSGNTYTRTSYNSSNTQYTHTLAASIADIPNSGTTALPVELTSFTASFGDNGVQLNWVTATEVNNYGFNIERCKVQETSNEVWQKVGFINGHGNSNSPKSYSYTDETAPAGKVQYRLKQIDFDGKFEYSNVVKVNVETPSALVLYQNMPNPFNPTTEIKFALPKNSNVELSIYNMLGEKVETLVNGTLNAGEHKVSFNASNLSSGVYLYKLTTDNNTSIKKMILMK